MIDADTDPARVGPQVIDAIGDGAPEARHHEVVHAHPRGLPLGGPFPPAILEVPHQFLRSFFFVSTEMADSPRRNAARTRALMYSNYPGNLISTPARSCPKAQ